jgi:hypothetical protein
VDYVDPPIDEEGGPQVLDLAEVVRTGMSSYVEWPHVDQPFIGLFATLPGRYRQSWVDGDMSLP